MLQTVPVKPSSKQRFILRRRFELVGAIAIAALLPWLLANQFFSEPLDPRTFTTSMIVNLGAIVMALWIRMSVETYPGIRAGQTILPAVLAGHAVAFGVLLLMRLPFHRPSLLMGVALHMAWAYAIYFFVARRVRPHIAVVPFGQIDKLFTIDGVDWHRMAVPDLADATGSTAIVADFDADLPDEWEAFLADAALAGRVVYQVEQLRESLTGRVDVKKLSENSFGSLVPMRTYSAIKHTGDGLGALLLLPLFLPIMAVCAIAIKVLDNGPVFFRQKRVGQAGRQFDVVKFRTMKVAESDGSREDAITDEGDVRITKIGHFLRQTRLDEFPQIFNVLRGEMSFIGPRPEAEVLSNWYTGDIPFYRYRHVVKPGISGWAQVNQGHVAERDAVHDKLRYDFFYIKYFSPWLDILILFRTARTMLTGWGAK